jgi:hypothetical protein
MRERLRKDGVLASARPQPGGAQGRPLRPSSREHGARPASRMDRPVSQNPCRLRPIREGSPEMSRLRPSPIGATPKGKAF